MMQWLRKRKHTKTGVKKCHRDNATYTSQVIYMMFKLTLSVWAAPKTEKNVRLS